MADQDLGKIQLTGGFEEILDTNLIIGRDPGQQPLLPSQRGVVHGVGDRTISRRHVEIRLDGPHVYVVSLGSKTLLRRHNGEHSELVRDAPALFIPGDTLHYGEGLSIRYAPDRAVAEAQIDDSDVQELEGSKQNEVRKPVEPVAGSPMALPSASKASHKAREKDLGKIAVGSRFAIIAFVGASVIAGSAILFWAQRDPEPGPISPPTPNATVGLTAPTTVTMTDVPSEPTPTPTASPTEAPTPVIVVPSLPTLHATSGNRTITATWSADDNGSPITRWEVDDGNLPGGPSPTATSHTWNDVAPGSYTIKVRACNAAGCGPADEQTVPVIGDGVHTDSPS